MSTVIRVENLSKQYRLGEVSTGTLSHDLNRWWHRLRGKPDPYLRIGEVNDRASKGSSEYVWALRDINFEVKHGEVLGIIGKNGAGKSTLLKILSRVTKPTTGRIRAKGRVASLLEVGTGFHPELTGKENIFLNGAILGMTKAEIRRKFDEIVDFSGVERYIDTPVKRYSSGMYVRLAFAVAAHLEPEILVVDEVLAVGDAEFQKKCLGKMKDVSEREGRTVLFVSHNMAAVQGLCSHSVLLKQGTVSMVGGTAQVIKEYLSAGGSASEYAQDMQANGYPTLTRATVLEKENDLFEFHVEIQTQEARKSSIDLILHDQNGSPCAFGSIGTFNQNDLLTLRPGVNRFVIGFDASQMAVGEYSVRIDLTLPNVVYYHRASDCLKIEVMRTSDKDVSRALPQVWGKGTYQFPLHLHETR